MIILLLTIPLALFIGYRIGKRKESNMYMRGLNMGVYLSTLKREDEWQRTIREVIESERGKG